MMEEDVSSFSERTSLCLSGPTSSTAVHAGDKGFQTRLRELFRSAENNTAEKLVHLKHELKGAQGEDFWNRLMEGMTALCHAQFAFVSKRILVDDHNSAIEMPPIGEVGSCLTGVALYWNDGHENKGMFRDYKYYAWNAPCSYMRYDKVFLLPEGLSSFITENPNQIPIECDAYLGIPLFAEGKCFAHFGVMWTKEGLEMKKDLSWGYVEMLMHALEDLISERLISGQGFAKVNDAGTIPQDASSRVIPQQAITATQSLKPYARSLSHELRTPMQGVVGMLDVMHATVQEQIEGSESTKIREIFQTLKNSIETVQDSSKRAVEAADNVVQAYDLNMQIPDTPSNDAQLRRTGSTGYFDALPMMSDGSNIVNPLKRRLSNIDPAESDPPNKIRHLGNGDQISTNVTISPGCHPRSPGNNTASDGMLQTATSTELATPELSNPTLAMPTDAEGTPSPLIRQSNIRDLIPVVIHESLRIGGRPDSAITEPTEYGERIEVRSRSSNGHASQKQIEWSVDTEVPEFIAVDERDLSKVVGAVFLNAIKFTENGDVLLHAKLSRSKKYVLLSVTDTGSGIPEAFQPELFKPFSQEDHSITRSKEGLGLGLLVAKGTARRIGGDIALIRSNTEGSARGTEFEIRIPCEAGDRSSRATTPFATPDVVARRSTPKPSVDLTGSSPFPPRSPTRQTISHLGEHRQSSDRPSVPARRPSPKSKGSFPVQKNIDKELATKFPLRILVAEDNKINRKLLVNMLGKFGYRNVYEAFDGREAVRIVEDLLNGHANGQCRDTTPEAAPVDVVLMDLWMPEMDGYEATERILRMFDDKGHSSAPIVLAVSADVTEAAVNRATKSGMRGYMTKPYKLMDLQRLILEFCAVRG